MLLKEIKLHRALPASAQTSRHHVEVLIKVALPFEALVVRHAGRAKIGPVYSWFKRPICCWLSSKPIAEMRVGPVGPTFAFQLFDKLNYIFDHVGRLVSYSASTTKRSRRAPRGARAQASGV